MTQRVNDIIEEARKLTPAERRQLFDQLEILFLGDERQGTPEEIEAAWLDEVERRIARHEAGAASFINADEVLANARARLRQR